MRAAGFDLLEHDFAKHMVEGGYKVDLDHGCFGVLLKLHPDIGDSFSSAAAMPTTHC